MSLERLFNAESVAVVGASRQTTKRGYQAIKTLQEEHFAGAIYPVNPKEKHILGLPCYPKVSAIPGPVDLVLITTPAATIDAILKDCGRKGVAGAVIIAGGFGELGREGRRLEDGITATARRHGIRLIGPNTSGMLNTHRRLNLVGLKDTRPGDIALLSQSGSCRPPTMPPRRNPSSCSRVAAPPRASVRPAPTRAPWPGCRKWPRGPSNGPASW